MPVNPLYPAHRWVRLGSFSFQSVELVKFAVMIWLAGFLAQRIRSGLITDFSKTLKPMAYALVAIGLVVAGIQSDLGSTGVMVIMMAQYGFCGWTAAQARYIDWQYRRGGRRLGRVRYALQTCSLRNFPTSDF